MSPARRVAACLLALALPLMAGPAQARDEANAPAATAVRQPADGAKGLDERITSRLEAELRASPLFDRPVESIAGGAIYDAEGSQIAEATDVARVGDNLVVLLRVGGGLFGVGSHEVAVPLVRFALEHGRLVLHGLSEKKLQSLPAIEADNYDRLAPGSTVAQAYRNG